MRTPLKDSWAWCIFGSKLFRLIVHAMANMARHCLACELRAITVTGASFCSSQPRPNQAFFSMRPPSPGQPILRPLLQPPASSLQPPAPPNENKKSLLFGELPPRNEKLSSAICRPYFADKRRCQSGSLVQLHDGSGSILISATK